MATIDIDYTPNKKQELFHACGAPEVFYGGAKGGGKSCALVMEALAYGLEYSGATIYLFRETYDDLEANLIKEWKDKVPKELQSHPFNNSNHYATLVNRTVVKFRYVRSLQDAEGYQGRSMDFIGVDELTKHRKESIQILLSCLRSAKGYPPRFRATGNPGGIGHTYVKTDFVEATDYGNKIHICPVTGNERVFIPATVYDNEVLMKNDANYVKRLENLPENDKKAFLYGDWDIFKGQYFEEFRRDIHVIKPFEIPAHWRKYRVLDYGLDMLACYWIAMDEQSNSYIYKELHESNLIISEAAKRIKEVNGNDMIQLTYAPPDLENRRQETGKSAFDIFRENDVFLVKSDNKRIAGWLAMKEWLKVYETRDIQTGEKMKDSKMKIFSNCANLINSISQIQSDEKNPNDVATEPHELTHSVDAIRYFSIMRTRPADSLEQVNPHPINSADERAWSNLDNLVKNKSKRKKVYW